VAEYSGALSKMKVSLADDNVANYQMMLNDTAVDLQPVIGQQIQLQFIGEIHCQACDRLTKKSYSGGFCYPCSQKLAQCDLCFLKPETCHYAAGTCREPEWGEQVCMQDHIVYLANSSGLKVGITRVGQIPTRWIDQGAKQAIPMFRVKSRFQSGLVEVMFKQHVSDRTDWRKMLKADAESVDLVAKRDELVALCADTIADLQRQLGDEAIQPISDADVTEINYPILQYPSKVKSLNFDKTAEITGELQGIKGQYLMLDSGVLNIRKFASYHVNMVV
jgi:hypothetical protein